MILTEREILDRVGHTKENMSGFAEKAQIWEDMWKLELWEDPLSKAHEEGREQITLPDPLNIVHMAERLIKDRPEINCPPTGDEEMNSEEDRKVRERFLTAAWMQNSRQQRKNIVGHAWWLSLVRSRFAFQVKWVEDVIPAKLRGELLPFHISVLDPTKCGFHHGPYYTEWAYYEYDEDVISLKQRFPDFDFEDKRIPSRREAFERDLVEDKTDRTVIEFWYMSDGDVYSAVLIDDELVEDPEIESKYNRIPLVEVLGDDFPVTNESMRSASILRPMEDLWQAQCRLVSQIATGLMWYYDPQFVVITDDPTVDLDGFGPGYAPKILPVGSEIRPVQGSPQLPISDRLLTIYETEQQQSSFPPSSYGATQGDAQSGYSASIYQAAARGRIKKFIENLQRGMEEVNRILLCFVDKSGKDIAIWGNEAYQVSGEEYYSISISKGNVNGNYANSVSLEPDIPTEELSRSTLALRYASEEMSSKDTARNLSPFEFPEDEQERIFREKRQQAVEEATNAAQAQILQMAAQIESQKMQLAAQAEMQPIQTQLMMDQQMQQQQMQMQQAMMMPQGMPPQGPQGVPQSEAMMGGLASQEMEGQLTPEAMGNPDPAVYQQLANNPSLVDEMNAMQGPRNGREVS